MTDSNKKRWGDISKEGGSLFLAEGISAAIGIGVVGLGDQIAPHMLKDASRAVGKIIEPYLLDPAEWVFKNVTKVNPDEKKSRLERAEDIGKTAILWTGAFVASFAAKVIARKVLNNALHVTQPPPVRTGSKAKDFFFNWIWPNKHDMAVAKWDEYTHYSALGVMNVLTPKLTNQIVSGFSNELQKRGLSKEKSDELAEVVVRWHFADGLGFVAGLGKITHHHIMRP